ncbi:MAG: hypothetical protein SGPRY_011249, partial [Prymnesium sp.]
TERNQEHRCLSPDLNQLEPLPLRRSAPRPARVGWGGEGRGGEAGGRRGERRGLRPLHLRAASAPHAAGSAYIELGQTKVLCSVFPPHQQEGREYQRHGQLECSLRLASFARRAHRRGTPGGTLEERQLSSALGAALSASVQLDRYPKSTVTVHAFVIEDDGNALAAAISCASLALADASILLYDMVSACSCSFFADGILALDCATAELESSLGSTLVAQMPALDQLTFLQHEGATPLTHCVQAMQRALSGSAKLYEEMQTVLLSSRKESVGSKRSLPPAH